MRIYTYYPAVYKSVIMVGNSVIYLWMCRFISYKFVSLTKDMVIDEKYNNTICNYPFLLRK